MIIDKRLYAKDITAISDWIYADQRWVKMEWREDMTEFEPIEKLKAKSVEYEKINGKHHVEIVLTSWKKRHIRRMFSALWYRVVDLQRVSIGWFHLGRLPERKFLDVKDFRIKLKKS